MRLALGADIRRATFLIKTDFLVGESSAKGFVPDNRYGIS